VTTAQERALLWFVVAVMAALPLLAGSYFITLLNYVGMSALAALGLVLLTGVGGLTSFGQGAFVGIGAYATAWLTTAQGASPWLGLVLALVSTGVVATILGAATLRLVGHFLPLSTIAWGLAIFFLFGNMEVLGAHNGMTNIPPVAMGGEKFQSDVAGYYLICAALGGAMLLCANLLDSRQGCAIRSLRGGTAMAESLGIDTFRVRLAVFVLAGLLAGLSGWLYAHVQRFISPTAFDVGPGIDYLFMAMLGGAGHVGGAVLGAALVTLAKDGLQDLLPLFMRDSGPIEIVVFGGLFILVLQHARGGLIPTLRRLLPRGGAAATGRRPTAATAQAARGRYRAPGGGGAGKALRRPARGERGRVHAQRRRNPRPDRPERRRQEHAVQPDQRRRRAQRRAHSFPRPRPCRPAGAADRGARRRPHLPARAPAPDHDAVGERHAGHASAHPGRAFCRRTAAGPRRGTRRPRRGASCAGLGWQPGLTSWPATCRSRASACWRWRARSPPIRC
jgi:ABC-type branched-subunit amino acid transport system permease subunit